MCVRSGPLRLSLVSPVALRLIPQLAGQPPTQWMSFGVVGVIFFFVIRAARGGQGGKLGFGVSLHLCAPGSWPCPVGM